MGPMRATRGSYCFLSISYAQNRRYKRQHVQPAETSTGPSTGAAAVEACGGSKPVSGQAPDSPWKSFSHSENNVQPTLEHTFSQDGSPSAITLARHLR
jgi:hypothetical protein